MLERGGAWKREASVLFQMLKKRAVRVRYTRVQDQGRSRCCQSGANIRYKTASTRYYTERPPGRGSRGYRGDWCRKVGRWIHFSPAPGVFRPLIPGVVGNYPPKGLLLLSLIPGSCRQRVRGLVAVVKEAGPNFQYPLLINDKKSPTVRDHVVRRVRRPGLGYMGCPPLCLQCPFPSTTSHPRPLPRYDLSVVAL